MALRVATAVELSVVDSAVADFRAHWASFPALWECAFAGHVEDVHALDYLDYEGLGYPAPGVAGAALVWGNVLARSGPFRWYAEDSLGGLVLGPARDDAAVQVFWPYGRVCEIQQSGWPPDSEKYRWLTALVVVQCLAGGGFDPAEEARLRTLIDDGIHSLTLPRIEAALGWLRG